MKRLALACLLMTLVACKGQGKPLAPTLSAKDCFESGGAMYQKTSGHVGSCIYINPKMVQLQDSVNKALKLKE